jgi:hypothetical protein
MRIRRSEIVRQPFTPMLYTVPDVADRFADRVLQKPLLDEMRTPATPPQWLICAEEGLFFVAASVKQFDN